MKANLLHVLGVELQGTAQGIKFLAPPQTSEWLQGVIATLRAVPRRLEIDPHLKQAAPQVKNGRLIEVAGQTPLIEIEGF